MTPAAARKLGQRDHAPDGDQCSCGLPAIKHRVYHDPKCTCGKPRYRHGPARHEIVCDPCSECGLPADRHRPRHIPDGDPCSCGVGADLHKKRRRAPKEILESNARLNTEREYYVGIDGEGVDDDGVGEGRRPHKYVLLTWADESGTVSRHLQAPKGERLTSKQCLDFILEIPLHAKIFAYSFGYDLTHILKDVDAGKMWELLRPETRQLAPLKRRNKAGVTQLIFRPPRPVEWEGYSLNMVGSQFVVERGGHRRVIWDVFKFYQTSFVNALTDWFSKEDKSKPSGRAWSPSTMEAAVDEMRVMKEQRNQFRLLPMHKIRAYNVEECKYLARLVDKLVDAHKDAKVRLRSFHGAGSTAGAMLKEWGIREVKRTIDLEDNDGARLATERARLMSWNKAPAISVPKKFDEFTKLSELLTGLGFFGGRFENAVIGKIEQTLYSKDLASAYPFQIFGLPCLACGRWEHTTRRADLEGATTALVRYTLPWVAACRRMRWGPFPFRLEEGTIAFPASSGGGWIWSNEFLAGERHWPNVKFEEAWVYRTDCGHRLFDEIARYYLERLLIGKEGAGIIFKLGPNACAGKLMQSIGRPPFRSAAWSGMLTAGTRSQILDLMGLHRDMANVLMIATDGLYSREDIKAPQPTETAAERHFQAIADNADAAKELGPARRARAERLFAEKPLGGWETKVIKGGMFACRPGVYFPLDATSKIGVEETKKVRARGIGRKELHEQLPALIAAWERGDESFAFTKKTLFHGARLCIRRTPSGEYVRDPSYGDWSDGNSMELSFDPKPKRKSIRRDRHTLELHNLPTDLVSQPYVSGVREDDLERPDIPSDEDDLYLEY